MGCIGVFDSGIGGLSVLAELRKQAPEHPIVYLADQAWAPYGERSLGEVRQRSVAIARFLADRGCDLIVVACNSASAAALHHLRAVLPEVRFVGMEPAVKPAATLSENGIIGVLATDATFQGELHASVVDRHANGSEVVEQACPGLAGAIERLGVGHAETLQLVERYVGPLRDAGVDTLVLGCTHYPFVLDAIKEVAGAEITVVDPAPAVAQQTLRLLGAAEIGGQSTFLTTGDAEGFGDQIRNLLGIDSSPAAVVVAADAARSTRIGVVVGDLTVQNVGAVVNAANTRLQHGGGVAGAIARSGGPEIQAESDAWVRRNGPLQVGGAAVTTAGDLPAGCVIHVAGPIYREGQENERLLRAAVTAALDEAERIGVTSVAFPAISAGIYGYPPAEAATVLADEVMQWTSNHPGPISEVRLVALDSAIAEHFRQGLGEATGGPTD